MAFVNNAPILTEYLVLMYINPRVGRDPINALTDSYETYSRSE